MRTVLSLAVIKGIIAQIISTALGMGLVMLIRVLQGRPAWEAEPVIVVGALIGAVGFLTGAGVFNDWFRWTRGEETPMRHGPPPNMPAWTRYLNVDYSHKVIGVQYAVTGILLMLVAGLLAMVFRLELAHSGLQFLDPATFNTFISAHGIVMIASILVGIGGMANYLVPLMIGASDMAFPRLNALGYWLNVPGAILVLSGMVVGGWNTGWTGYPPLSAQAPIGVQLFFLGVYFVGLSSIVGALNLIVTTLRMRAPGMTLFRMPIFVWAMLATSLIQLTATQLIGLSFLMVVVQRL
jgi:cytochrome c oxidase subunit 1